MGFAERAREILKEIEKAKDSTVHQPYLNSDGDLVIPFGSDSRYHWWAGGQTAEETIKKLKNGLLH